MNALANPDVGDYLNKHFIATFQKVGTFQTVHGQKQGGNVASYFCTPHLGVLDAVAGPVDAATFLREARWVVETRKMGLLQAHQDMNCYKWFFRLAHAERLPPCGGPELVNWQAIPLLPPSPATLTAMIDKVPWARGLDKQSQVHLVLAAYPLAPLDQVYPVIYQQVLGEKLSTVPVSVGKRAAPGQGNLDWLALGNGPAGSWPYPAPPSPEAMREQARLAAVRRAGGELSAATICSAEPLNLLLDDLARRKETAGKPEPLDGEILAHLNLTADPEGAGIGPLKAGAEDCWPPVWHQKPLAGASTALREAVTAGLKEALAQAHRGPANAKLLAEISEHLNALDRLVVDRAEMLAPGPYTEAKQSLRQLRDALKVLGRPDAPQYVGGGYVPDAARVKTVQDLVAFMAGKGLRFAPAATGDEPAYLAVHHALAAADPATQQPPQAVPQQPSMAPGDF